MEITKESVQAKLDKGEALTPDESKFVMSLPPEGAESNIATKEEEEIDWGKAEDLDGEKKEETAEQKKTREDKEAADKKVKQEEEAKKKAEDEAKDPFIRIERELAKPEGQADLKDFTEREKAYYHQMRLDRKNRQKAEEERDALKFNEIKRTEDEKKKEAQAKEEDPLADLKKRDPEDFLTVKEVTDILEKTLAKKPEEKKAEAVPGPDPIRLRALKAWDDEARANHKDDYDAVMELHEEIVAKNESYLKEIASEIMKGENPAEVVYRLIKQDAEFSKLFPAAQAKVKGRELAKKPPESKTPEDLKKEEEAKKTQDALKKNQDKPKTTGHAEGETGGEKTGVIGGYTIEQIMNMSDLTFSKLPKDVRDKFLKMYG